MCLTISKQLDVHSIAGQDLAKVVYKATRELLIGPKFIKSIERQHKYLVWLCSAKNLVNLDPPKLYNLTDAEFRSETTNHEKKITWTVLPYIVGLLKKFK